jgi:hypothetical protein
MRGGDPDGLERAAAVADPKERLGTKTPGAGPPAPLLLDIGGGVHQDPVQVEHDGGAFEAFHGGQ